MACGMEKFAWEFVGWKKTQPVSSAVDEQPKLVSSGAPASAQSPTESDMLNQVEQSAEEPPSAPSSAVDEKLSVSGEKEGPTEEKVSGEKV